MWEKIKIFLTCCVLLIACDQSPTAKQSQNTSQKENAEQNRLREKELESLEVKRKYNATFFPPLEISSGSFSYEIQRFFKSHSDELIGSKGYLEDIVASGDKVFAEFLCPYGDLYFLDKKGIRLRLLIEENILNELLRVDRVDPLLSTVKFFDEPDFLLIAKITDIVPTRKYEFIGSGNGEDIEIEPQISKGLIAIGQLSRIIPIPIADKPSNE